MRIVLIAGLCALAVWVTLGLGVQPVRLADIWAAIRAYDPGQAAQMTLREIRLPRLLAGLIAGAAFATAGTVMQALTRNPLADPGLLGVNAGAACSVVIGALWLDRVDAGAMAFLALPGALIAALAVFTLGGGMRGETGPVGLTLAGVAMNALLLSVVSGLIVIRGDALDVFRYWVAGSLAQGAGRPVAMLALMVVAGWGLALASASALETLGLGRGLARGLGTNPLRVQAVALLAITLLTAAGVAMAGPIAFLGLIVPPLARRIVGTDLRHEVWAAPVLGAAVLLLADGAGRLILAPVEVRVGIMTAILGGPVFIWIARSLRPGEVR